MDEVNIVSKVFTHMLSRALVRAITNKMGDGVSVRVNSLRIVGGDDGAANAHIDADIQLTREKLDSFIDMI